MRAPVDTNTLPPDLAARFAALRAPATSSSAAVPSPEGRSPTSVDAGDDSERPDALEQRLAELSAPNQEDIERGVKVETAGLAPSQDKSESDDEVERYLARLQPQDTEEEESISLPSPPQDQPAPSARARKRLPPLSPSLLDTLSGVEIQFFRPSLGAATGDVDPGPSGFEAGSQEDDLMRRLRDELKLEANVQARDEGTAAGFDARLQKLKEFSALEGAARMARGAETGPAYGAGAGALPDIGQPPDLGELERQRRKREKRLKAGKGEGSDSDSTDSSTEESSGEATSDSEEE